jgi:hypothetical protein
VADGKLVVAGAHAGRAAGVCSVEDLVAAAPTTCKEAQEEGEAAPVAAQITQGLPGLPGESENCHSFGFSSV